MAIHNFLSLFVGDPNYEFGKRLITLYCGSPLQQILLLKGYTCIESGHGFRYRGITLSGHHEYFCKCTDKIRTKRSHNHDIHNTRLLCLIHLEDPYVPEFHHISVAQETDMTAGIEQTRMGSLISRAVL